MIEALKEAQRAYEIGEVPVGCVIVKAEEIIAKGHNQVRKLGDITAHAEIMAIREASKKLNTTNLTGLEIYITLEPCPMCATAIMLSKINKIVYALDEDNFGSLGSYINLKTNPHFKNAQVYAGILEEESKQLLRDFFKELRK